MEKIPILSFTSTVSGRARALITPVSIHQAFTIRPGIPPPDQNTFKKYNAIWDTGATTSVITSKVVQECQLKPIGMAKVNTAAGEHDTNVYLICVTLPNNLGMPSLKVTEGNLGGEIDVLIGMDIIASGDFAVTNKDGKTMFSYRFPSIEHIDFVKATPQTKQTTISPAPTPAPKIGRNSPCTCGSGKKYKKCCGK